MPRCSSIGAPGGWACLAAQQPPSPFSQHQETAESHTAAAVSPAAVTCTAAAGVTCTVAVAAAVVTCMVAAVAAGVTCTVAVAAAGATCMVAAAVGAGHRLVCRSLLLLLLLGLLPAVPHK
jgi:hypothetical protein